MTTDTTKPGAGASTTTEAVIAKIRREVLIEAAEGIDQMVDWLDGKERQDALYLAAFFLRQLAATEARKERGQ